MKPEQFRRAFDAALAAHRAEIDAIAADKTAPSFANTVEALERSGALLNQVSNVFFVLAGADTSDAIEAVEREISPLLARHSNALYLNAALFKPDRRALPPARQRSGSSAEQMRVLERYHTHFVRAGAGARPDGAGPARRHQRTARDASAPSSGRTCWPTRNPGRWSLEESDLAGLPDFARARRRAAAETRGHPGKYAITLARSSIEPFPAILGAARPAREGRSPPGSRAARTAARPTTARIIAEIVRAARRAGAAARLCELSPTTGSTTDGEDAGRRARAARRGLGPRAASARKRERDALQDIVAEEGGNFALAPWDWRYYAEKLRKARYDLDEAQIKPYLALDNMIAAAFETATRLFGLTLHAGRRAALSSRRRAPGRCATPTAREIGLFIGDYFARASKHSGAWMTSLRDQEKLAGDIRPIILNV